MSEVQQTAQDRARVSVVICAWNNWPDLEMTIESALGQSYESIEVIVVDNASTDGTKTEVQRRFSDNVRYIRQENCGDSGAYNTGFSVARGEFIQFLDGDDVLAPGKIEKQIAAFQASPELDIVYGDIRHFQTIGGAASWLDVATQPEEDILREFIAPRSGWSGIGVLGMLFRRRALEMTGPWDESLYICDLDYLLRAAWAGCRFGHCAGSPMGFVRRRPGQMSANRPKMQLGLEAVWEKAMGYITREPYRAMLADHLADCRFHLAVSRGQFRRSEAVKKLTLARATSPRKVSALAYALGYATIVLPGGSFLVRSRPLRAIRRTLASMLGFAKREQQR
jgi:glycosyltransferase involved in cell wall biosynthesis